MSNKQKPILDLTPGLIASAMLRQNHGVFMTFNSTDSFALMVMGDPEENALRGLNSVVEKYRQAKLGELKDIQIMEEFTGDGFYHPDREADYVGMLDQFSGMVDLAKEKIACLRE